MKADNTSQEETPTLSPGDFSENTEGSQNETMTVDDSYIDFSKRAALQKAVVGPSGIEKIVNPYKKPLPPNAPRLNTHEDMKMGYDEIKKSETERIMSTVKIDNPYKKPLKRSSALLSSQEERKMRDEFKRKEWERIMNMCSDREVEMEQFRQAANLRKQRERERKEAGLAENDWDRKRNMNRAFVAGFGHSGQTRIGQQSNTTTGETSDIPNEYAQMMNASILTMQEP